MASISGPGDPGETTAARVNIRSRRIAGGNTSSGGRSKCVVGENTNNSGKIKDFE
jgi:hypothetical protein